MATSVYGLRKLQFGKEVTKGTPVATTEIMQATGRIIPRFSIFRNQHPVGLLSENLGSRKLLSKDVDIAATMNGLTYEQITWLLNACIDVPTTAGAGPYTHTYDPGIAALAVPDALTVEMRVTDGTLNEDLRAEYAMIRSLKLSIEQDQELRAEFEMFAKNMQNSALTAIGITTGMEPIIAADAIMYINDTFAAADADVPGSGSWTGKILSAQLELMPGLRPLRGIAGSTTFNRHFEGQKNWKLSVKAWYDPAASDSPKAERAKAMAATMRFVTLSFAGVTAGNKLRIVLCGTHENGEIGDIAEDMGADVVDLSFVGHADDTSSKLMKILVGNNNTTAP